MDKEPKSPNFSERQQNPTPRELFELGQKFEAAGNKLAAAYLYEQAGYTHKAIQIHEAEGDIEKAYKLAKQAGDNWTADRLALTYNIPGHEYSDFPQAQGREFDEIMRIALKSRLQPGATASRLGFVGFKGKTVADVGTRDGRFVPLFQELGAKEVYGIDPDEEALKQAVDKGLLDQRHALPYRLQDLPEDIRRTFEIATIFNFNIPISEQADFFAQLYRSLPEGGQAVLTVAEDEILQNAMNFIEPLFAIQCRRLWNKPGNYPHKNLAVLTKKPFRLKK
jgi:SAM-dependent methyltransferase